MAIYEFPSAEIDQAARQAIARLLDEPAFAHAQRLADLERCMTAQEELEFLRIWFGPDAGFLD